MLGQSNCKFVTDPNPEAKASFTTKGLKHQDDKDGWTFATLWANTYAQYPWFWCRIPFPQQTLIKAERPSLGVLMDSDALNLPA